ncbi:MAG: dTMP kinase [Candidatus Methanomethylophilaceae archaeon]|jgi:dTMP kinase|nr:dTMP kinase [Candidatus Methanomethylophilaceae archaeon]
MRRGLFVVFEGIDGSGKSSCMRSLAESLSSDMPIQLTAEPSEGPIGAMLRQDHDLPPMAETLLFVADRAHHTACIQDWLQEGRTVLCDRYYASTLAYQSCSLEGHAGDREWLWELNRPVVLEPDLTILMDIDPEAGLKRTIGRGESSKFEKLDFLSRVRQRYLEIAQERGFMIIDASAEPAVVRAKAEAAIRDRMEV